MLNKQKKKSIKVMMMNINQILHSKMMSILRNSKEENLKEIKKM